MVKKLIKYSKGYRLLSVITPILVVMESFIEIYIPYVMADLIDQGIYGGNMSAVAKYGLFLIGAALVSLSFGVAAGITAPFASAGFASNLRRAMFDKVQEYDFQSIDKFSTPSIVTRLTTDVTNVQQAYQMIIRISARAPSMLILALIAAYRVNHELSRVFLVAIPMLAVGVAVLMISVHPIFKKVFKKYDEMNGVVQESVRGIRVVKSFNRQDFEIDKFKTSSGTIFDLFSKAEKRMAWMAPIVQFTSYTIMILLCWIGGRMIVASGNDAAFGLTTGELMSMVTYTTQILMSLMMLSMIFLQLTMARESGARIVAILDETSGINDPEDPIMEVKDGSIDFDGVSFSYSHKDEDALLTEGEHSIGRLALDSVDLHIKSGQTVGILGGTGSSKSTLVQLIPRLYDVSSGSVKVGGVDVRDYNITVLRDKVAMVLQKNVLFSGTIRENLLWGNENATDEEIRHALKVSCSDEFVNKLPDGIETVLDQGGTNISGGQRQRLCIARALLKKPRVIIMDDSTSAVDVKTDRMIREAFSKEMPDVTRLIIAQRISSVMDSDMIVVMDGGKIVSTGTHEELLEKSDIYREIYDIQNETSGVDLDVEGGED
ncbi:MAG: ABC transporter ATP-binding protein [Firmicutes bacterium]|nr:ABC transporter ATP-binding protein [Bacillota bacterium]MBQ1715342.1 ABC transporter ATP-binding protein [Bacillota bacterium]